MNHLNYDSLLRFLKIYFDNERVPIALLVCMFFLMVFSGCNCQPNTEHKLVKEQISGIPSKDVVKRGDHLPKFQVTDDENHPNVEYRLTKEQIVEIASKEMVNRGYDLRKFLNVVLNPNPIALNGFFSS